MFRDELEVVRKAPVPVKVLAVIALALTVGAMGFFGFVAFDLLHENAINGPLSCDELPSEEAVRAALAQHSDRVAEIQSAGAFSIDVVHGDGCADKAYILIQFDVEPTEKRIRKVIGKSFYGVPYRMQNI